MQDIIIRLVNSTPQDSQEYLRNLCMEAAAEITFLRAERRDAIDHAHFFVREKAMSPGEAIIRQACEIEKLRTECRELTLLLKTQ